MYQMLISLLVLFDYFISGACGSAISRQDGEQVTITCNPQSMGTIMFWFRVRKTGIEPIGVFDREGNAKMHPDNNVFDYKNSKAINLKSFKKDRDSGAYSCGTINNNKLIFGELTDIEGPSEPAPEVKPVTLCTTPASTPQPCSCQTPSKAKPMSIGGCPMVIWAPLTAACSLIIVILILIIGYCNRIRTRRCPHHYKRRPKNVTPARQAMTDRYH